MTIQQLQVLIAVIQRAPMGVAEQIVMQMIIDELTAQVQQPQPPAPAPAPPASP